MLDRCGRSVLRRRVAELYHEILYHTMEKHAVEGTQLRDAQEGVTMYRCLVHQLHIDVALRCLYLHDRTVVVAQTIPYSHISKGTHDVSGTTVRTESPELVLRRQTLRLPIKDTLAPAARLAPGTPYDVGILLAAHRHHPGAALINLKARLDYHHVTIVFLRYLTDVLHAVRDSHPSIGLLL